MALGWIFPLLPESGIWMGTFSSSLSLGAAARGPWVVVVVVVVVLVLVLQGPFSGGFP